MKVHIKITRQLYNVMRDDLDRPHPFAWERVGFLSAKVGNKTGDCLLIFLTDYHPIPDEHYIEDKYSGARINSDAIRAAMQRVLDTENGAFHVHIHNFPGVPGYSFMDREEIPKVVLSLQNANPSLPHGIILLSTNHGFGQVWLPDLPAPIDAYRISVIGYPVELWDYKNNVKK